MIYLYSGTPGSGKSLYSAYDIINKLKRKQDVIANFSIDLDYFGNKPIGRFTYLTNEELTVNYLKQYAKICHKLGREGQTLLVIDECACMFNSRQWDRKDRQEWITFFQQHRKLGYNIILIAQNDRLIDRQIRAFIETEFKHRAIKNYKTFGRLLSFFCGGLFVRVEYWYGTRLKCGSEMFVLNRKKAKIYDTTKIFE